MPNGTACPKVLSGRSRLHESPSGQVPGGRGNQTDRIPCSVAFSSRRLLTPARRVCKPLPCFSGAAGSRDGRVQNSGYPHTGFFFDHHHAQLGRPRRSLAFRVRRSVLTGRRIKAPVSAPGFFLSCRISRKVVCTPLPAVWERCTHTGRNPCRRACIFQHGTRRKAVPFQAATKGRRLGAPAKLALRERRSQHKTKSCRRGLCFSAGLPPEGSHFRSPQ